MHAQLELLLQIQDLRSQLRELTQLEAGAAMEEAEFRMDPAEAAQTLEEKIGEMEEELAPAVRERCRRMAAGRGRAVVPVIGGTCYGCFTSIATATAYGRTGNDDLRTCENCGRYLYVVTAA